jgi:hypothetical protein
LWTNVQSKRTTRAEPEDHLWSADHSLRNIVLEVVCNKTAALRDATTQQCYQLLFHLISSAHFRIVFIFFLSLQPPPPHWAMAFSCLRFLGHTQRTTVARTHLNERLVRRRDLYLTTRNIRDRYPCPRWDSNPQLRRRTAADLYFRPRGHWDRRVVCIITFNFRWNWSQTSAWQISSLLLILLSFSSVPLLELRGLAPVDSAVLYHSKNMIDV